MISAFQWIVVPVSTVLGLTITRILTGFVAVFKARERVSFDWLPLVFAGAILGVGFQFWWALLELSAIRSWSLAAFGLLLAMVMSLFSAAALIVPADSDTDMRAAFARDGHWALAALACFHLLAMLANGLFFQVALLSAPQGLLALMVALCLLGGLTRRRRVQEAVAALYVVVGAADIVIASVGAH